VSQTTREQGAPVVAAPAVVASAVSKGFTDPHGQLLPVLDDVSMDVRAGEFVCIVGPSGCGKTTLLRMMQGLEVPSAGEVLIHGQPAGVLATAFVFQRASLLPWRTVERNVSFGLDLRVLKGTKHRPESTQECRARVRRLLELTDLTDFAHFYPSQISGGMQQRVNLARALAIEPVVLLMDEPFSALDAQTREKLQRDLQRVLQQTQSTTVFITHDIREAVFQADRVFVMSTRPGRIREIYTIDEPHPRTAEYQNSDRLAATSREIWRTLHDRPGAVR
jgi:ABC-type nitrate/sulfonate/bicarbonate transport system ATPase subunit